VFGSALTIDLLGLSSIVFLSLPPSSLLLSFSLLSVAYLHVVHPLLGNHRDQVADRLVMGKFVV
jgi:hypothetical protein